MDSRPWTEQEKAMLRRRYPDTPNKELAQLMGRTPSAVCQMALRIGLRKSAAYLETAGACRYRKGNVPHNSGKKGWDAGGRSKETRFKPGNISGKAKQRYKPLGSERVTKNGYLQRKVNNDNPSMKRWKLVHHLVWEEHNGPIPAGHVVVFKNGNKRDFSIDNLELISQSENMLRNTIHRYPPELKKTIKAVGKLRRLISEKQN